MHSMKKFFPKNNNQGFTLVETLVAIIILMSATAGIVVVSGGTVGTTALAKNTIIANALSQEGIEMVRAIRDTAILGETPGSGGGWQTFIEIMGDNAGCFSGDGCYIENIDEFYADGNPLTLQTCPNTPIPGGFQSGCPKLTFSPSHGYGYDINGEETPFQRTIFLECVDGACEEVKVHSEIVWKQGSVIKNVASVEHLLHWYVTQAPPPPPPPPPAAP